MALSDEQWQAAWHRLERPLFNVLYRRLWSRQECEDLMQDTFLRLWQVRDRVDEHRLDGLVYTTALRLAANRLRWHSLWRFVGIAEDADAAELSDPALDTENRLREGRLKRILSSMSRKLVETLLLSEFAGFSTSEIAEMLNIPPGTVGSRKSLALKHLRKAWSESIDG